MSYIDGLQRGSKVDLKNCVLFIKSLGLAGVSPNGAINHFMALRFSGGSLSATVNKEYTYETDRGHLDDVRRGDDKPMNISFDGKFTFHLGNYIGDVHETASVHELLHGVQYGNTVSHGQPAFAGMREDWLYSFGCPPYCVELEVHNNPGLDCPDTLAYGEAILYRYFRCDSIAANFDTGAINVSGMAHIIQPMVARVNVAGFGYTTVQNAVPLDNDGPFWQLDPRSLDYPGLA